MTGARNDTGADYDALRCDLIDLLMEHRSQGRFTQAAEGTDHAELTRSIADILVVAYRKNDLSAYASALTDAETIASSVLDRGLLASH